MLATTVYGAEMYAVRGSYDDCSRLVVELAGEVDWGIVNVNLRSYYAEGSKTLAFEIAEQLGWETPTAVVAPIASGAMFTKLWQGFEQFRRLGLVDGDSPRLYGGQAEGCSPVAAAFAEERRVSPVRPDSVAHSLAIGKPADGDLAIATAQRVGRRDLRGARGRGRPEHVAARGARRHLRRGRRRHVGALRAAVARRDRRRPRRRARHRHGLKTPQRRSATVEIDADVDALLDELGCGARSWTLRAGSRDRRELLATSTAARVVRRRTAQADRSRCVDPARGWLVAPARQHGPLSTGVEGFARARLTRRVVRSRRLPAGRRDRARR